MDTYFRQEEIDSSEDENQNFGRCIDENGITGLQEGGLELDNPGFIEEEEDEQQKMLSMDVGDKLEQDEDDILFPESPSDGDRSGGQSWKGQFVFSEMPEERQNQDLTGIHDTDDLSLMDQPSRSITLPSSLGRRPPSRDQQLDMTEDEVDQGSSLGAWDGDEDENWNTQQLSLLCNGTEYKRLANYDNTSVEDDQWENPPGLPGKDYSKIIGNPSTWDNRLFGILSLSPGIEAETLPEPSHTNNHQALTAVSSGDHGKGSRVMQMSSQSRLLTSKSTLAPSSTKLQYKQHSKQKKSKNPSLAQYGRGQLNYPVPDFSKVGPRVRFPRDEQGYRPPQPRRPENQNQIAPIMFKSPAEIVREVLLSSAENPVQEPAIPPTVPQEFKTPQQATELVHQLQEDYHKLLTKYAEAENTIDRLRLGAKIHLYSDPAKPSHSVQMGTVMQRSKTMEFTIPHAQTATFSSVNEDNVITIRDTDSCAPMNHPMTPSDANLPGTSGSSFLQVPEDSAFTLRSHLETLHREVDLFEGLLQEGNLTPEEQRQAVRELRGSLDMLEQRYLQAQEQYRQEQRHTGRPYEELDPERELEEAIFQLGVQLDELQERVDHSALSNSNLKHTTHHLDNSPLPSALVPIPTTQTPYPQVPSPEPAGLTCTGMGMSDKEDPEEYLPQPVRYKHTQLERDYGTLLSTYSSFKSLPDALGLEQDEWPQQLPQIAKPHEQQDGSTGQGQVPDSRSQGHVQARKSLGLITPVSTQSLDDHAQAVSSQDHQLQTKANRQSLGNSQQCHPKSITPHSFPPTGGSTDDIHASSPAMGTNVPVTSSPLKQRRPSSVSSRQDLSSSRRMPHGLKTYPQRLSLSSSLPQLKEQSPRTPTSALSVSEESIQGSPTHKSSISIKNNSPAGRTESPRILKERIAQRRILSPETDSGFLGSESGRSFPLQKPRHQLSLNREDPIATQDSSNDAVVRDENRLSKNGISNFPGTHKVLRDNGKQNNPWTGPSEASSPSLGPRSLTESESREDSHTDESDSEQERSNDVIGDVFSGASPLLSPTNKAPWPLRNIMESRLARDQAIHDLQQEVTQLHHLLENSLNRSPARGKPVIVQKQHNGEVLHVSPILDSAVYRPRAPVNDSRAERQWVNSVSHDHDSTPQATPGGKGVQGAYTGTRYQLSHPLQIHTSEHVSVPYCQKCQESERKKHVTIKTSEKESDPPTHPACLFCKGKKGSDNASRTEMPNSKNRHHRRHQNCQHWYTSHPSSVSYIPSPHVPYSPPIIYSTPPGLYVPLGYNVADMQSSFSVAPSSNLYISDLDCLSYPLNQALKAAKKLEVTSKQMCQSLTTDLSMHHSLRGSCLF